MSISSLAKRESPLGTFNYSLGGGVLSDMECEKKIMHKWDPKTLHREGEKNKTQSFIK